MEAGQLSIVFPNDSKLPSIEAGDRVSLQTQGPLVHTELGLATVGSLPPSEADAPLESIAPVTLPGITVPVLAYDAEIRFPTEPTTKPREGNKHRLPPYIRYDLNFATTRGGAAHDNVDRGLRSHCHPGHDALQAPSPLFHPLDLLDLLVYRLRWD